MIYLQRSPSKDFLGIRILGMRKDCIYHLFRTWSSSKVLHLSLHCSCGCQSSTVHHQPQRWNYFGTSLSFQLHLSWTHSIEKKKRKKLRVPKQACNVKFKWKQSSLNKSSKKYQLNQLCNFTAPKVATLLKYFADSGWKTNQVQQERDKFILLTRVSKFHQQIIVPYSTKVPYFL